MDRTDVSENAITPPNAALQRLQNDAVQAKPVAENSKSATDYLADAVHSAVYTGIQEPISGVTQIVDEFAGTKFRSQVQFMKAPEQATFGSGEWHAQQVGAAVGTLLPFLLVRKGVRGALGTATEEAGLLSSKTAFNMSLKEAALTGFTYDAVLRPSQTNNGGIGQFLLDRGTQGAIGAGTFTTMTAAGLGLKNLAGSSAIERSVLLPILKNPIASGVLSGAPAGLFNAEANSFVKTGHLASGTELAQSAYSMSLLGAGFGVVHSLKGTESGAGRTTEVNTKASYPGERLGLKLAAGDITGLDGTRHSVSPESLEIAVKPTSFTELAQRITGHEKSTEPLLVSKPGASANFESTADFLRNNVENVETPVRVYSIDGHETKIVVPETYARQLDAVRQFRLGLEGASPEGTQPIEPGLLHRALPEDFVQHLDSLPNKGLADKLYLLNEPNPLDPLHQRATGDPQFQSQASTTDRSITFFQKNLDAFLGDEVRHEWSHIARDYMPTESSGFDLAAEHEGKNFEPRSRAAANADERWTVLLGEEMLNPDASRFLELTNKAPLQSVMLAEGLKRSMSEAGSESGVNAAELQARLRYIDETIKPQVIDGLVNDVRKPQSPESETRAAKLLIRLGEGQRLNDIPTFKSLDLSGEPIGSADLTQVEGNRNIEYADLSFTNVGRTGGLGPLENLPLKSVSLAGTKTTGSALRPLERIPTLESADLSGTDLGDNALSSLRRMTSLKHLDLSGTNISDEGVKWLREQLPQTEIKH
ncbi:MAG TPA: hypothetical protein V6C89_07220 [Drouetiella sp.]|jgi:Leucine Rich repeat